MEKRFYLGLGILLAFLVLGLAVSGAVDRAVTPVAELLRQAEETLQSGNWETGIARARQAGERWRSGWRWVALAADHSPMDEIDGLFAQIEYYARVKAGDQLGACCTRVAELVEAVTDAHKLTWWNIL